MLKKLSVATMLALAVAVLGLSGASYAGQAKPMHARTHAVRHASLPAGTISVVGINRPMKTNGTQAAGQNELRIVRATDEHGKVISSLAGKTIQYSDSGKGKDLMTGYNGKRVRVTGTLDKANNVFTVASYKEIAGKKMAAAHTRHHAPAKHMAKTQSKPAGSKDMAKADNKPAESTTAPATPPAPAK